MVAPVPFAGLAPELALEPWAPAAEAPTAVAEARPEPGPAGLSIAEAARYYLAHAQPPGFTADCAGFVAATHALAGVAFRGSPPWMWEQVATAGQVHHDAIPSPGDIAFFDDTYDRNGDRVRNDPKSHVAIVLSADRATGDILLAHGGSTHGRALLHMNLRRPSDPDVNSGIRRPSASEGPGVPRLAGELFTGFGRVGSGGVTGSRPVRTPCSPSPCPPPCSACGSPGSPTAPISPSS